ncbi:MAG TPA: YiiX/YebB-like N1pC/P60 family cysteine hydrolase [Nitrospirota bacterium]|nr:YiiX/YebB-like N1pC/P60 family cysteine hydrolase [Nitrospirota bacterium]
MTAGESSQSPPSRRKKQPGRSLKRIGSVTAAIAVLYLLLLIPFDDRDHVPAVGGRAVKQPFVWDQDEYWEALEATYRTLKQGGCTSAVPALSSKFQKAKRILHEIDEARTYPDDPVYRELEAVVFEMGTVVGACNRQVTDYLGLIADMRTIIKKRSADWDMNSASTRITLYRLLYGSRAAAEEVILQTPAGTVPKLVPGKDEPARTPWADVRNVRIHSGDILVSRGGAPTSALIARGSDYPGNFSHIAFVYVDPATRTPYIVESHIERGVVVSTVEQYLEDKKLRVMLLRLRKDLPQLTKDPMIPHKAAEIAYNNATKKHIPYDFEMNYREHSKLFCSEVASAAYETFGVKLWMGISHLSSPGLQRWLSDFGVRYFETQEPSDLEYDPQLVVVAEWRDPETLKKDHYDNAVTEVMLAGAEEGDELSYQWYLLPVVRLAKAYSVVLNLMGKAGPVPEGMTSTSALRNVWYSDKHETMLVRLSAKAAQFNREQGYAPPYWELVNLARSAKTEIEREQPRWRKRSVLHGN